MWTRRELLRSAGLGAGALAAGGCDRLLGAAARGLGEGLPARLHAPACVEKTGARHLLDRAAFGPWPGDVEAVTRSGSEAWLDAQLAPGSIDDAACELRIAPIDVGWVPDDLVFELRPEDVEAELATDTLLRAVYSRRQLQEVLVACWLDHFNVTITKSLCRHLEVAYVREAIRPHALGSFRALLGAVTTSPAMLVYLDGRDNHRDATGAAGNENHARELLELHTLGVRGGYTQRDVMEAARCLGGWIVDERWAPGRARFVPERHDDGEKQVLGARLGPRGGAADVERLLDLLVAQPACAEHVAHRLCVNLVADDPPARAVRAAAETFRASDGHVGRTVRTILLGADFAGARDAKLKRPFRLVASALRALACDTHARGELGERLTRMGQAPFRWPAPDGYPDRAAAWLGTLPARWGFALALAEGRLEGTRTRTEALREKLGAGAGATGPARLYAHLLGRKPAPEELDPIRRYLERTGDERRALALMLSSPAFQRH